MRVGERRSLARELLARFADRTGLDSGRPPRRYLWTDAFAVCTWLGLGETEIALRLVDQVHHVLGRHRADDRREGWLSGLEPREAEAHPTLGGLRIGKKLPERGPGEPYDERLEWDRDGQYFHYLTRWMHALDRVARATRRSLFNEWGRELAVVAHRAFVESTGGGPPRMFWKMSIDLTRPLVASMGQHDPLDGYVTCLALDATARSFDPSSAPHLERQEKDFAAMIGPRLSTADPLGLGGLLVDALRVDRLAREFGGPLDGFVEALAAAVPSGLLHFVEGGELRRTAGERLAFRELGLSIGLAALSRLAEHRRSPAIDRLVSFLPLRDEIESFWQREANRQTTSWHDHDDINDVMLAASLAPEGYLGDGGIPGGGPLSTKES